VSIIENALTEGAFWKVNKAIARHLGSVEAALLLADLIAKRRYFREKSWLDENDGFFNIAGHLEDDLMFSKEKRIKLTKTLRKAGFLTVVKKGIPSKNYYYLNDSSILAVLSQSSGNPANWSAGNTDDLLAGNPATNKNKQNKNKNKKNKASTSTGPSEHVSPFSKDQEPKEEIQKAKEAVEPLAKKTKEVVLKPLAKGLDESEMIVLAEMKHLDDYDQGFLADMCDVPIEQFTDSQVKRLEKIRRKAAKSKKIDKARPLDSDEINERYNNSLLIEKHTMFVVGLETDRLMYDKSGSGRSKYGFGEYSYSVKPNDNDSPELYRARVLNEIKLMGERGELSPHVE